MSVDHEQAKSRFTIAPARTQRRSAPRVSRRNRRSGGNSVGEHGSCASGRRGAGRAARLCAAARTGSAGRCIKTAGLPLVLGRLVQDPKFPTVTHLQSPGCATAEADEWRTPPFKLVARVTSGVAAAPPTTRGQPWPRSLGLAWPCRMACASTFSFFGNRGRRWAALASSRPSQTGQGRQATGAAAH